MRLEIGKDYKVATTGYPARVVDTTFKSVTGKTLAVAIITLPGEKDDVRLVNLDGTDGGVTFLVEVTPWDDFKVDDKVLVWVRGGAKRKAYFAGITAYGKPQTFRFGSTSWSAKDLANKSPVSWDFCERAPE